MKRAMLLMMVVLVLTAVFPVSVFAEENTVMVDGAIFSSDMKTFIKYPADGSETEYVIPEGVTNIGERAFDGCANLVRITLPNSITTIGDNAFSWCTSLEDINIHDGITEIGRRAFMNCHKLKEFRVPNQIKNIGIGWFLGCESLENVTMHQGVVGICEDAFGRCESLKSITLPDSVIAISHNAFDGCKGLENINIPKGVEVLSDYAFLECESLENIIIPEGTIFIGRATFKSCIGLKSITIPKSMTFIEQYAFDICSSLTDVYYCGTKDEWNNVFVCPNNAPLTNATIHFECVQEEPAIADVPAIIPETEEDDGKIKVTVDGERVIFPDQEPIVEDQRVLVPLRAIFEALGAEVEWDNETKTVYAEKGEISISMELGSNELCVGNISAFLDVPATALNGRVMVPTRAIAEAFGYVVDWSGVTNTVVITTN